MPKHETTESPGMMPTDGVQYAPLTVVIPTNSYQGRKRDTLTLVLESLAHQTLLPYQTVIVTHPHDDSIGKLRASYPALRITQLPCEDIANRSAARNCGVAATDTPLILFIDDDTVVLSNTCIERVLPLLNTTFSFACAAKRYWTKPTLPPKRIRELFISGVDLRDEQYSILPRGINRRSGFRDLCEYSFIGNFGIVRRAIFEDVNGFDTAAFAEWGCEDVDLMLRLYVRNQEFINLHPYVDVLHMTHPIRGTGILVREFGRFRYEIREREIGYHFCVNNLFGVDELDHNDVLVPVNDGLYAVEEPRRRLKIGG